MHILRSATSCRGRPSPAARRALPTLDLCRGIAIKVDARRLSTRVTRRDMPIDFITILMLLAFAALLLLQIEFIIASIVIAVVTQLCSRRNTIHVQPIVCNYDMFYVRVICQ